MLMDTVARKVCATTCLSWKVGITWYPCPTIAKKVPFDLSTSLIPKNKRNSLVALSFFVSAVGIIQTP